MKFTKIVTMLTFVVFGHNQSNAQNPEANISNTLVVEASADAIWSQLRKLDNVHKILRLIPG